MPNRAASSHKHVAKRPFQQQITNFFSATRNDPLQEKWVEENVQADLLNVGMRIRKAVPEGYKTHKTIVSSHGQRAESGLQNSTAACERRAEAFIHLQQSKELVPLCGVHRVGGLAMQQPIYREEWAGGAGVNALGIYTNISPWSSQESGGSAMAMDEAMGGGAVQAIKGGEKRMCEEESESEEEDWMSVVPREGRVFAKMRRRKGAEVVKGGAVGDFEDASFLLPFENGGQVQMGEF